MLGSRSLWVLFFFPFSCCCAVEDDELEGLAGSRGRGRVSELYIVRQHVVWYWEPNCVLVLRLVSVVMGYDG